MPKLLFDWGNVYILFSNLDTQLKSCCAKTLNHMSVWYVKLRHMQCESSSCNWGGSETFRNWISCWCLLCYYNHFFHIIFCNCTSILFAYSITTQISNRNFKLINEKFFLLLLLLLPLNKNWYQNQLNVKWIEFQFSQKKGAERNIVQASAKCSDNKRILVQ